MLLFVSADRSVNKSPYEGRINIYTWDGDIESNGGDQLVATPHDAMVQKILRNKVICVSYKIFGTRFYRNS